MLIQENATRKRIRLTGMDAAVYTLMRHRADAPVGDDARSPFYKFHVLMKVRQRAKESPRGGRIASSANACIKSEIARTMKGEVHPYQEREDGRARMEFILSRGFGFFGAALASSFVSLNIISQVATRTQDAYKTALAMGITSMVPLAIQSYFGARYGVIPGAFAFFKELKYAITKSDKRADFWQELALNPSRREVESVTRKLFGDANVR